MVSTDSKAQQENPASEVSRDLAYNLLLLLEHVMQYEDAQPNEIIRSTSPPEKTSTKYRKGGWVGVLTGIFSEVVNSRLIEDEDLLQKLHEAAIDWATHIYAEQQLVETKDVELGTILGQELIEKIKKQYRFE